MESRESKKGASTERGIAMIWGKRRVAWTRVVEGVRSGWILYIYIYKWDWLMDLGGCENQREGKANSKVCGLNIWMNRAAMLLEGEH